VSYTHAQYPGYGQQSLWYVYDILYARGKIYAAVCVFSHYRLSSQSSNYTAQMSWAYLFPSYFKKNILYI
jgi:hypothetical protein